MICDRAKKFLDGKGIKYAVIEHSPAYTAQEIAASAHIPGREMAKTVIVEVNEVPAMVVLPASRRVSIDEVGRVVGSEDVRLAHESKLVKLFPDCELGAMPPLGNLYGLDVYVHPELAANSMISFNAGSHVTLIRMSFADFERVAQPHPLSVVV